MIGQNEFPQIYLIPRTSRQSYDLVEIFNDEYEDREQTIEFTDLNIPSCVKLWV